MLFYACKMPVIIACRFSLIALNCKQVELHLHGDGACRLETLRDLARQYQRPYPYDDLQKFKSCVCITSEKESLKDALAVFDVLADILR